MVISVSFLKNKNGNKETIEMIDKSLANMIHVDMIDDKFVKGKSISLEDMELLSNVKKSEY